jgi:hypothetical protein
MAYCTFSIIFFSFIRFSVFHTRVLHGPGVLRLYFQSVPIWKRTGASKKERRVIPTKDQKPHGNTEDGNWGAAIRRVDIILWADWAGNALYRGNQSLVEASILAFALASLFFRDSSKTHMNQFYRIELALESLIAAYIFDTILSIFLFFFGQSHRSMAKLMIYAVKLVYVAV